MFSLNEVITATGDLLRETVGPRVTLVTTLAPDLALIDCDPNQAQQILVNLAANARDAMASGGQLLIETANINLDEGGAPEYSELVPGRYVELRVTDERCRDDTPGTGACIRAVLHHQASRRRCRTRASNGLRIRDPGRRRSAHHLRARRWHHVPDPSPGDGP